MEYESLTCPGSSIKINNNIRKIMIHFMRMKKIKI